TATRCGVNDAGTFRGSHVLPAVDDAVRLRGGRCGPLATLLCHLRNVFGETVLVALRREVVERPDVLPTEHVRALHLPNHLVSLALPGLRFEMLLDAVEVWRLL